MSKTIFYNHDQRIDFCFEDDQNQKSLCEVCGCEIKKKRGMRFCLSCFIRLQTGGMLANGN